MSLCLQLGFVFLTGAIYNWSRVVDVWKDNGRSSLASLFNLPESDDDIDTIYNKVLDVLTTATGAYIFHVLYVHSL